MKKEYKICPHCWKEIKSVAIKCQYCLNFLDKEPEKKTKECPFCLNEININEIKCPYCDENLTKKWKINLKKFLTKKYTKYVIWIIVLVLILLMVFFFLKNKYFNEKFLLFEKNQKCREYADEYLEYLKKNYTWHDEIELKELSQYYMFYSPIENTCVVAFEIKDHVFDSWYYFWYSIVDYLSWKTLYDCTADYGDNQEYIKCLSWWSNYYTQLMW